LGNNSSNVLLPPPQQPSSSSSISSSSFSQPPLQIVVPPIPQSGSNVTKCLEQFFPNGIILPFNIPPFLSGIVNVINLLGNTEVDLSVDISGLAVAIHNKGMVDLDHKLYKEASHAFRALGILQPEDFNAFYHVACAEALLGNYTESLLFLNKAIDLGYRDKERIVQDASLNPISYTKGFELAMNRLNDLLEKESSSSLLLSPSSFAPAAGIIQVTEAPAVVYENLEKKLEGMSLIDEEIEKIEKMESTGMESTLEKNEFLKSVNFAYQAELDVLRDIGYFNDELVIPILEKNKGNVQQTVLELLDL